MSAYSPWSRRGIGAQSPWAKYHRWISPDDPDYVPTLQVFREYELAGIPIDDDSAAIAVRLGKVRRQAFEEEQAERRRRAEHQAELGRKFQKLLTDHPGGVVYYVRRGDFVKIGTTRDLRRRLGALRPDEILAVEPGSFTLERERHRQFAHCRATGEYFKAAPELATHLHDIRAEFGVPDQSMLSLTDGRSFFGEA